VVQARARVDAGASNANPAAQASPAPPRHDRGPGTVGGVHIGQILWVQALAAAVAVSYDAGPVIFSIVLGVAVLLAIPAVLRVRRRWLFDWMSTWLRYKTRQRQLLHGPGDPRVRLLEHLEPSTRLDAVEFGGEAAGLLAHAGGISVVMELVPSGSAHQTSALQLPSLAALLPGDLADAPPTALQLLVQVLPAPSPVAGDGPIAASYRELSGLSVPAQRRAWLVLQLRRTADAFTDADLRPALATALQHLRRRLRKNNVAHRVLDLDELLAAAAQLADVDPSAPGAGVYGTVQGRAVANETWRAWSTGTSAHASHRLVRWPAADLPIDEILCSVPATINTLSVAVTSEQQRTAGPGEVAVELGIRLSAPDHRHLAAANDALAQAVRRSGGLSMPLDGDQRAGAAATMVFGGFLR
jgi:type VII secretion protein EccE